MLNIPEYIVEEYKKQFSFIKKGEHLLEFTGYSYAPVTDKYEPQPILPTAKCVLCSWSGFLHSAEGFECRVNIKDIEKL